jgi:hypothetical protein
MSPLILSDQLAWVTPSADLKTVEKGEHSRILAGDLNLNPSSVQPAASHVQSPSSEPTVRSATQRIPQIFETRKFISGSQESQQTPPVLSKMNPAHGMLPQFQRSILIVSSHRGPGF